jgi:hypothetical protein
MSDPTRAEGEAAVMRAVRAFREGEKVDEKCVDCGGAILVDGGPPGGPYTHLVFTCPCQKSSGFLTGI